MTSKLKACIICGYLHERVGRGISALGEGDEILSKAPLAPQALVNRIKTPPPGPLSRPPYRCAWVKAAQMHQVGVIEVAAALTELRGGNQPLGLVTTRKVAVLALVGNPQPNARCVWVGLVDDPDESTRLLVGGARIVASGLFGFSWHANNVTGIPIEIAPGSREGMTAAVRTAVRHALDQR